VVLELFIGWAPRLPAHRRIRTVHCPIDVMGSVSEELRRSDAPEFPGERARGKWASVARLADHRAETALPQVLTRVGATDVSRGNVSPKMVGLGSRGEVACRAAQGVFRDFIFTRNLSPVPAGAGERDPPPQ
jgi:hypothetical protein